MKAVHLLLCVACLVIPSTACADWQYTRWGMTRDQVIAASGGAAIDQAIDMSFMKDPALAQHRADILADSPTLHAPHASGTRTFDAQFTFKEGGLARVTLKGLKGPECYALLHDLQATYGKPFAHRDGSDAYEWQDIKKNNSVIFGIFAGLSCFVQYAPLQTSNSIGL